MSDKTRHNTTVAIGVMTASMTAPDGSNALTEIIMSYLDDGEDEANLVFGLHNVALLLLTRMEKFTGRTVLQELQYLADRYGEQ